MPAMPTQRVFLGAIVLVLAVALGLTLLDVFSIQQLEPAPSFAGPVQPAAASSVRRETSVRTPVPERVEPQAGEPALDGPDRVRGEVVVAGGQALPAQFELLASAGDGPPRVFSFQGPEKLVTLDLGPGRWLLFARAEGLASRQRVLERKADSPTAPFRLLLEPAGRLGGQVLDVRGAGLAELPVWLLSSTATESRRALADAQGRFAFADVPLGAYRISFGSADSPIAPLVAVEVVAGEVREVPPQTMPELGEGEMLIVDRANQAVVGARVFGAGTLGGWIEGFSDTSGRVRTRFLPAGTFFLNVSAPDGRAGQGQLEVRVGRIAKATIQIR